MHIPTWPWNRHRHRCLDCAFLSERRMVHDPVLQVSEMRSFSIPRKQRNPLLMELGSCHVEAYDLEVEVYSKAPPYSSIEESAWRVAIQEHAARVANEVRTCTGFTRLRAGYTLQGHLAIRERAEQHQYTLIASVLGGLVGGSFTLLGVLLS